LQLTRIKEAQQLVMKQWGLSGRHSSGENGLRIAMATETSWTLLNEAHCARTTVADAARAIH
jgi:hypothetical protein